MPTALILQEIVHASITPTTAASDITGNYCTIHAGAIHRTFLWFVNGAVGPIVATIRAQKADNQGVLNDEDITVVNATEQFVAIKDWQVDLDQQVHIDFAAGDVAFEIGVIEISE